MVGASLGGNPGGSHHSDVKCAAEGIPRASGGSCTITQTVWDNDFSCDACGAIISSRVVVCSHKHKFGGIFKQNEPSGDGETRSWTHHKDKEFVICQENRIWRFSGPGVTFQRQWRCGVGEHAPPSGKWRDVANASPAVTLDVMLDRVWSCARHEKDVCDDCCRRQRRDQWTPPPILASTMRSAERYEDFDQASHRGAKRCGDDPHPAPHTPHLARHTPHPTPRARHGGPSNSAQAGG